MIRVKRLLILEDDKRLAESLKVEFVDRGYDVTICGKISETSSRQFDYAIVDLRLSGESGVEAIERLIATSPECRVVILTGYGSVANAVETLKRGAVDFLTKPASAVAIESALLGRSSSRPTEFEIPTLAQIERDYIDFILNKNGGNISKTAKDIGLHRQSLQRKLRKFT